MRLTRKPPLALAALGGVAAGVLLFVANPPADLGWVAFAALVPLLWALSTASATRGALVGLSFGLVYWGLLMHWLLPFGVIAWLPLVIDQAATMALFGAVVPLTWRADRPVRTALTVAALWTFVDWIRGVWPLGGFTWGALGATQHGNHLVLPLASITGVWGVTFVMVLANVLLLFVLRRTRPLAERVTFVALGVAAVTLPVLIPLPAAAGPKLDVAVVQGNVPRALASDRYLQSQAVAQNHIRLNRTLASNPPDVAVWPENALDDDPTVNRALGEQVSSSVRAVGSPTLVGAVTDAPGGRYYNQVLLYDGQGRVTGRYTKTHLVPFGEYVPFRRYLGWVEQLRAVPRDLAPGPGITLFHVHGVAVATPICFEDVFPDLFRRFVAKGANLVVLTTNDSSFLESEASREHVELSQVRAVETGRWVVQAAISGESAVIDPTGRVVAHTGLFEAGILRFDVPTSSARTLYVRLGDWFPWLCGLGALVALAFGVVTRRRGRIGPATTPPAGERHMASDAHGAPVPIAGGAGPRVLIVLPTYNERDNVGQVVQGVLAVAPDIDVLVVDDGSPDGTGNVVRALANEEPRVRLVERSGKQGLASAYLAGFRQGLAEGYDVLVEMDADQSHRPEDLARLLEGSKRFDLTIGSRYVPGSGVTNWSRARLAVSRGGNAYARAALGFPVHDATSGYRAFRRGLLETLVRDGFTSDGYAFQIELAYRSWRLGYEVGEVPITFREREHGHSKFSRRIVAEALWRVTQWGVRDRVTSRTTRRTAPEPLP